MRILSVLAPIAVLLLLGCTATSVALPASSPGPSASAPARVASVVEVFKSPTCGCCHEWEAYMRSNGWEVRSVPVEDMTVVKTEHAVPTETWSCHTALVDGYVVEGHVPVEAIADLLRDRPAIDGIGLPGMPPGSPGMPGEKEGPFEVLAFVDGVTSPFGSY